MSTDTAAHAELLADRYGRRSSQRRTRWWVAGVVIVAGAALGVTVWSTIASSLRTADAIDLGFEPPTAHEITLRFQITTRPDVPVACALEAQDAEHGVVGWRIVEYPADAAHSRIFTETVPTVAEATTAFVKACWIP
ncbi:DUF4307 domain-containing protein [Microbacterium sp. No. 7]|uniref:DUF4307 domain-containing protein n=1 Tax=Microbacterium sp. No. 7 TaxID=1714373 RepID=UPI0006D115C3|nr:DUF4307 domain-containing protein [Microbacterium sp. No. 7]ALJ19858.1 hypothetical protein AOA12_08035 [Microbacterium sp. No. 7]